MAVGETHSDRCNVEDHFALETIVVRCRWRRRRRWRTSGDWRRSAISVAVFIRQPTAAFSTGEIKQPQLITHQIDLISVESIHTVDD